MLGGSRDSGGGRLPTLCCVDQAHRLPAKSVQQEGVEVVLNDFYLWTGAREATQ